MISISNIFHIARYESKAVKRGWFFKIAALGIVGFLSIFSLTALATIFPGTGEWDLSSLSAKWPYSIMVIMNMIMPFVAVFLATGLMKKNKKLDTNEVFLTRPISNADYVLGRVVALFIPILLIHIIVLVVLAAANIMSKDALFDITAYLFYPLMMSLPNLVFVTGLAFMLISLIRNQAVSLVVALGILGALLIQFSDHYYYLFDFSATRIPLLQSDMIGIRDFEAVLYQRLAFFILGIGFLSFAILLLDRLPMKRASRLMSLSIGILCLAVTAGLGYTYLKTMIWIPEETRELARSINDDMYGVENINITDCDLELTHGARLEISTHLTIKNETKKVLDTCYFYLNPGLNITSITQNGKILDYKRQLHKISIILSSPLSPGKVDSLNISYVGDIDQSISYLEVEKERLESPYYMEMFSIPKKTAFVTSDYLLLTSEALWYPQDRPNFVPSVPGYQPRSFVNYTLKVTTKEGLTPLSQGAMTKQADSSYLFTPEQPLPQISLVVGNYENRSITVDSTDFNFTTYEGHDYFVSYYDQVQDTIPEVIRVLRKKVEQRVGLKYPFKRFTLVEVPATFHAYFTLGQNHQAYSQPEMVFMPEMGGDIFFADLNQFFRNIDRWRFEGQKVTDKKRQAHAAHDYLLQFLKSDYNVNTQRNRARETQYYSIVPNMLWFVFDVQSKEWPLITKNINDHLSPVLANVNSWSASTSIAEECNSLMLGKDLETALKSVDDFTIRSQMVKSTGKVLMARLQEGMGDISINDFIKDYMNHHAFESIDFNQLKNELETKYDLNFEQIIQATYANKEQPFYSIDNMESYAISEGANQQYQLKFDITNLSETSGIIEVEVTDQTENTPLETKIITLEPHQTKRWASVTQQRPKLSVNTLISQNIPQEISLNTNEFELKPKKSPENGVSILENYSDDNNEIIVDNEDSGFAVMSEANPPLLQQLIFSDEKVSEFESIYRAPRGRWSKASNNNYFGKHIRSAHFVRTGDVMKKAIWSTEIKNPGYYDVYAYSSTGELWWSDQEKKTDINHYIVYHADGQDEVVFDKKKEKGWVFLGSFYLTEGETKVELTNESDHRLVFADAVKWKRNDVISNK